MLKNKQNQAVCERDLNPGEARQTTVSSWHDFAPREDPSLKHLSSSQVAKASRELFLPKESGKEAPAGWRECERDSRGESVKQ